LLRAFPILGIVGFVASVDYACMYSIHANAIKFYSVSHATGKNKEHDLLAKKILYNLSSASKIHINFCYLNLLLWIGPFLLPHPLAFFWGIGDWHAFHY